MLKSKWFFVPLFMIVLGSGYFVYKKYFFAKSKDETAFFMQMSKKGESKSFGIFLAQGTHFTSRDMANGVLCLERAADVEKIDLFMPDMGHGSEPPVVSQVSVPKELINYGLNMPNYGCFSIKKMQLFMPGLWQLRVIFKDKNLGIFNINIDN